MLLVAGDDERVVVVHADASTIDIDPHSDEAKAVEHTAMFDWMTPYVVTASTWRDDYGMRTDLRLFGDDGTAVWTANVRGSTWWGARVSDTGEVVFQTGDPVLIRDGTVSALPGFAVLDRPTSTWVPVWQGLNPQHVGWISTDTLAYVESGIVGPEVRFDGEKFVGARSSGEGIHVEWARHGETASELFFPHTELTLGTVVAMRSNAGPFVLFMDEYEFTTMVLVDIEHMTADARLVDPPAGYVPVRCGWPTLAVDGTVLMPFSDGSRLQLFELPLGGKWRATMARPLSATLGGYASERSGSYLLQGIDDASPCFGDEPLAAIEGTLRGNSRQVFRPETGVHLELEELAPTAFAVLGAEGRCAALVSADDSILVADMELGAHEMVAAPTTSGVALAGQANGGWSFELGH